MSDREISNDPTHPDDAIKELYLAVAKARYPSLAWMVCWDHRIQELWDLASDDVYMRRLAYVVIADDWQNMTPAGMPCTPRCFTPKCAACADQCRKIAPRLPSVQELVSMRRKRLDDLAGD